jgi:ATP-dependent RNA helicase DeaD
MLTSDLSQKARERVMGRLRRGELRFLVATDIAARGIDVPDLSHVIQFQPPEDPEAYIHRAGRTGRAGASGEAITLVSTMDKADLHLIEQRFSIDLQERELPTPEDVQEVIAERLTATLESRLRSLDRVQEERLERLLPLARQLAETEDEWPIIAMLLDKAYVEALHAPPPAPETPPQSHSVEPREEKKRRRRKRKPRKRS